MTFFLNKFRFRPSAAEYTNGGPIVCASCSWKGTLREAADYDADSRYFVDWTCPSCAHENTEGCFGENVPILWYDGGEDLVAPPAGKPGLRCAICAEVDLPASFTPPDESEPEDDEGADDSAPLPEPHHLAELLKRAMADKGVSRRDLARGLLAWFGGDTPPNARRWNKVYRHVDNWLSSKGNTSGGHGEFLVSTLGVDVRELVDAKARDKELSRALHRRRVRAEKAAAPVRRPPWAELVRDGERWTYRHLGCGRVTHEDDRVLSTRSGVADLKGTPLDYLVESWALADADARSTVVFRTDALVTIGDDDLTGLAGLCFEESERAAAESVERSGDFTFVHFLAA